MAEGLKQSTAANDFAVSIAAAVICFYKHWSEGLSNLAILHQFCSFVTLSLNSSIGKCTKAQICACMRALWCLEAHSLHISASFLQVSLSAWALGSLCTIVSESWQIARLSVTRKEVGGSCVLRSSSKYSDLVRLPRVPWLMYYHPWPHLLVAHCMRGISSLKLFPEVVRGKDCKRRWLRAFHEKTSKLCHSVLLKT